MARPLNDSPYLYGLHDQGGEQIMAECGTHGWILFTEALGNDPNDQGGRNYSQWADQGFGIMVRLNNGYEPNGTIPYSNRYAEFANRCANFVRASSGCHIWIVGNEMNIPVERPGVQYDRGQNPPRLAQAGEVILPGLYVNCFRRCRDAIRAVPGHTQDQVVVGAVAPWNNQTSYDSNLNGDWIQYFEDVLKLLSPDKCDGIAIHAYTHGSDPKLVYTDAFMNPPFQKRQYNFRTYQDFMNAIPRSMRSLPVYLTETDQDDAWVNTNNGWVQRAYGEIDWWNKQPGNQVIRAVILYRWSKTDRWAIDGRAGVIDDFKQAMQHRYNWETALQAKTGAVIQPEKPTPEVTTPVVGPAKPQVETPVVVDTSPIKFDLTGKTAKGLFAAFYRKYGLDVTGYPISEEYVAADSKLKTQDWQRLSMEEHQGAIRLRLTGQEAVTLRGEITTLNSKIGMLEKRITQLTSGIGGTLAPEITDITAQLSRDAAGFVKRTVADIQFVVINHTGVRPEVTAQRVAQAQRAKWPGIVSQYYITADGSIQQTNPINEVVTRDQNWIFNGVNIYVAGNFDETTPNEAQMAALAQLCAWLLSEYNLAENALRGVSEFIVTRSPGLQWLQGQRWKDQLLERVRAAGPVGPVTPIPQPVDDTQLVALRTQLSLLQTQAADLQAQLTATEAENARLQAQVQELLRRPTGTTRLPQPTLTDISLQLPRTAGSLKTRPIDQVNYVVINHTAVDPSVAVERIAAAHQKRWGSILYQYLITGEGTILQTNALTDVVDLTQPWIAQGINVAVAGSFSGAIPSDAQIKATAQLCAWLMQEHAIPAENVKGVSEFIVTQSPGTQWLGGKKWRDLLLAAIADVQKTVSVGPSAPVTPTSSDTATLAALRAQVSQLQAVVNATLAKASALQQERDRLQAQLKEPAPGTAQLTQQVQTLSQQVAALTTEKATLTEQTRTLTGDKTTLTKQVQTLTAEKTSLSQQLQTLSSDKVTLGQQLQSYAKEKATLTQQVQTLTATNTSLGQQVSAAAAEKQTLARKVGDLEARITQLQSGIGTGGTITPAQPAGAPMPAITDLVDKLPKHATLKYDTRPLSQITHIAVHHSAAPANVPPERIAAYHVGKDWPAMGYHFYVGPDGTIYQCERLETISYQVYKQNHYSMGICVAGSFVNGAIPTAKQIEAVGDLVAWLTQKLNVPMKNVWGHKEFPENQTACPGNDWNTGKKWKQMVLDRANAVLAGKTGASAKNIGHYMLFWQRADSWAQEDWAAAAGYFARFRPTAGFSAEDAKNAEYVTIVGGVAGVSYETEQALTAAGCKVERLAGVDFNDTKRMLDELASLGKRFKTFNVGCEASPWPVHPVSSLS